VCAVIHGDLFHTAREADTDRPFALRVLPGRAQLMFSGVQ
jgi:hypothetical protein